MGPSGRGDEEEDQDGEKVEPCAEWDEDRVDEAGGQDMAVELGEGALQCD